MVAAGLAERCQIQVAYAIGVAHPTSLFVETFGTEAIAVSKIEELVNEHFDLRPAAILRDLDLRRPIYVNTAAYGHFGREDAGFTLGADGQGRHASSRRWPRNCDRRGGRLMSITVVGSVAFDALETPFGRRDRILGGAASHFSLAASFFDEVRVVGVVGEDFGPSEFAILKGRGINTDDLEQVPGAKSFFWSGSYERDLDVAHTLDTQLNVFADFDPKPSRAALNCDVLFLANIQPDLQRRYASNAGRRS